MHDFSIISMVFTAILALGCLYLVISPFFQLDPDLNAGSKEVELARAKETLLSTLNEIEFEYRMDKLSSVDFKKLKRKYEDEIAAIMKEEEQFSEQQIDQDLMDEVEREIQEAVKSYQKKGGEES